MTFKTFTAALMGLLLFSACSTSAGGRWRGEWPETDFDKTLVDLDEIVSGGPPRDGIPAIDHPEFEPVGKVTWLDDRSPVVSLSIDGDHRAYPLGILNRHEIVNDVVGGTILVVTYCPLCNSAEVFDRFVGGRALAFGTSGKLRNSNLVMYDRQTESWWQQFTGKAIVGDMAGTVLERIPARIESFARFKERFPAGSILKRPVTESRGIYTRTPYRDYDSRGTPMFNAGPLPKSVPALSRVVRVGDRAWSLKLVRVAGRIETPDGLVIRWEPGQASALDRTVIANSRDVGNVIVQQRTDTGLKDISYGVDFAFAFQAFHPDTEIVTDLK